MLVACRIEAFIDSGSTLLQERHSVNIDLLHISDTHTINLKITMPHLLQMISPELGSVIIASSLLHKVQTVEVSDIEFTLSSFGLFMNILFEETLLLGCKDKEYRAGSRRKMDYDLE
jgi:hypothetical protein